MAVHLASESLPDHPPRQALHNSRPRNRAAVQDVGRSKAGFHSRVPQPGSTTGFHSRVPQPAHLDLVTAALAFFSGLLILS